MDKREKITRFLSDKLMSESVYYILLNAFLKGSGTKDVSVLAAERISISLLPVAWKELEKFKNDEPVENKTTSNPGL
ncbi:MAG: hypothetical protein Q6360_13265 [Candidatus Brocadiales bacterium]|nr:hypothetical protein [Candidatus Brocadiales bacterium]